MSIASIVAWRKALFFSALGSDRLLSVSDEESAAGLFALEHAAGETTMLLMLGYYWFIWGPTLKEVVCFPVRFCVGGYRRLLDFFSQEEAEEEPIPPIVQGALEDCLREYREQARVDFLNDPHPYHVFLSLRTLEYWLGGFEQEDLEFLRWEDLECVGEDAVSPICFPPK